MKRTLIQWISIALEASKVSHPKDRQHIAERWSDLLDDIENNLLLSGSGFDAGTALDREKSTNNKSNWPILVFKYRRWNKCW